MAQVNAEIAMAEAADVHEQAEAVDAEHDHNDIIAARVGLVLAEQETRRRCG